MCCFVQAVVDDHDDSDDEYDNDTELTRVPGTLQVSVWARALVRLRQGWGRSRSSSL